MHPMKLIAAIVLSLLYTMNANAQNITGEYYLRGVMETASGFQVNADSSFLFFFSYGALDRYGKGRWSLQDNSVIVFNSAQRPTLDFRLEKHETSKEKTITIQVDDNNKNILRYVQGFVKTQSGAEPFEMNDDGIAQINVQQIDSIALIFTLCPDRYSVFPVTDGNNYFVFRLEPWIAEVFFENFTLKYSDNTLTGKHPLLEDKEYTYEKE
jgi:hypothetical protein